MSEACFICLEQFAEVRVDFNTDNAHVKCLRCGEYVITRKAQVSTDFLTEDGSKRYLLSGVVRENSERGKPLLLTFDNIKELISSARPPRNPVEAIDRLLLYLADQLESPSTSLRVYPNTAYPVVYARNADELSYYLMQAERLGYTMNGQFEGQIRLDMDGWQRIDELRRTGVMSDQAFVAMWFDPEVSDAWTHGIKPALSATGYLPIRLDFVEHNERIDDRIIAEIRRSGLVVADFTGDRGGVYFEAGFALGLGIPVIWSCREDHVEKLHFDTRQYNYIAWSNPDDLREKLELRIRATIPNHPNARTNA
jgi:nucleoside 2-deoxyribosyltransferase